VDQYGIESTNKKQKKNLQVIAEILVSMAKQGILAEESDPRLAQFVKKRHEITCQLIEDWLNHQPHQPALADGVGLPTPWSTLEESIRTLHLLIYDKMSMIHTRIGTSGVSKTVTFKMADMLEALIGSSRVESSKVGAM